jgi:hypothetical protein
MPSRDSFSGLPTSIVSSRASSSLSPSIASASRNISAPRSAGVISAHGPYIAAWAARTAASTSSSIVGKLALVRGATQALSMNSFSAIREDPCGDAAAVSP